MSERPFNAGDPIAYLLTWTTYGSWLPGDDRGSWHEGVFQLSDGRLRQMATSEMKETVFITSPKDRATIEDTIRRHCEIRGWALHAVSARSNHVHVVVTAKNYDPKTVRDQFKAWCTRHLKSAHPGRKRFWTKGGSCRSINHEPDLATVVKYVFQAQDRKARDA